MLVFDASPEAQQAFQFLPRTAMHEGGNPRLGKCGVVNVAEVDGRRHYAFGGLGEVFGVLRPEMSKEMERQIREMVREIPGEEGELEAKAS